jgi:hypothetical protein
MNGTTAVWDRVSHPEDGLTERKPEGAGERDFKETVVAFANAVPQGSEGVLFIGVSDKGDILGCSGVESLQKTVTRICTNECYPPIAARLESRQFDGKDVLAVIVPHSTQRPHFSGHAFRRVGSQNLKSDEAAYSDFIVARSSVGAKILENKGKVVLVRSVGKKLGDPKPVPPNYSEHGQFVIKACDPHTVTLESTASNRNYVEQIENFSVSSEPSGKLLLIVRDAHR